MSTDDWRERLRRFQGNDLLITFVVIVVVIALVLYEIIVLVQGSPLRGTSVTEGPIGRILLGLLAAFTYFKSRQTHKDVVQDVGATTELRETVQQDMAPAIREAAQKIGCDNGVANAIDGAAVKQAATITRLIEEVRVQRHDFLGKLQASDGLRELAEIERRAAEATNAKLEARVNDLTERLAKCAELKGGGGSGT